MSLQKELAAVLNCHCCENASNTPDFILAQYLLGCLNAFNEAMVARTNWYAPDTKDINKLMELGNIAPYPTTCDENDDEFRLTVNGAAHTLHEKLKEHGWHFTTGVGKQGDDDAIIVMMKRHAACGTIDTLKSDGWSGYPVVFKITGVAQLAANVPEEAKTACCAANDDLQRAVGMLKTHLFGRHWYSDIAIGDVRGHSGIYVYCTHVPVSDPLVIAMKNVWMGYSLLFVPLSQGQ